MPFDHDDDDDPVPEAVLRRTERDLFGDRDLDSQSDDNDSPDPRILAKVVDARLHAEVTRNTRIAVEALIAMHLYDSSTGRSLLKQWIGATVDEERAKLEQERWDRAVD